MAMSKQYSCDLCKKVFKQKIDFTRHQNKKAPCITLTEMQQISQTKEVKMDNKTTLINVFKNCLNILRDNEGLTGEKALRTLSYLIILKLLEPHFGGEIDIDNCYEYDFVSYFEENVIELNKQRLLSIVRFTNLSNENEDNLPTLMKYAWDIILSSNPTTKKIFLKGKGFDIQHKSTYKKLIDKLNSIDLTNSEYDVLGNAYEEVIQDIMTGKVLGQFFTQPLIKKMMVKLINPQIHPDGKIDTCGDPTMGTGGFLITYLQYILQQATSKNIKPDWDFIKTEGLYGKELDPDTYQLAVSNMLISSGHMFEGLDRGDSIRVPITRKFDNILANPPFGIKGLEYDDLPSPLKSEYVPIKTDNAVSLFIQAIIYMLKINGKCAVVLPYGQELCSKTNTTLVAIREYLMKTCDLKEIIHLPPGIFTYTSIKTCVFYFVKKREGTDVLETKIKLSKTQKETGRDYKFSKTYQTTKVKFYDYNPYEDVKDLFVEVPIEKIVSNSYSLNYTEYMKDETEEEQYNDGVIVKTLGEVCNFDIGGTPSRSKNEYYENGNNLWVSVRELNGGYIYDTKEKITDLGVQNSSVKLFAKDTILFSFKLSIGKTAIVGNPLYTNEAIAGIFSKNNDLLNNKYLYYYLTINNFSKLGSGMIGNGSLNKKSLEQIKIPIPSLERQQEIVKYLDFIYEKANKTSNDKIAELKQLNEFCLNNQKIFGENVVKTLGEVCQIKCGNHSTKKYNFIEGDYLIIGGGKQPIGKHNEYNCDENTILCASHGTAGYISMYPVKTFLTMAFAFIENKILINKMYLYYYLKSIEEHLISLGKGTAQPCISREKLKSIKIPIPSLELQREIVKYLDYNDTLVKQLEKEIENNKKQAQQFITGIVKAQVKRDVEEQIETSSVNTETNEVIQDTLPIEEEIVIEPKPKTRIIKKKVKKPLLIVEDEDVVV
jgi:type I restriction-modification system DNA methylase subunit/restriction endonuclease S subunit